MFSSSITKNLNWKILTENLVTFRWDRAGREGHEKPVYREELPKKWAWTVCRFKGGLAKKEGEGVFEGAGGLIPQCALCSGILQYIL